MEDENILQLYFRRQGTYTYDDFENHFLFFDGGVG